MDNPYEFWKFQSEIIKQITKINAQLAPFIQIQKQYADLVKPFIDAYPTGAISQLSILNKSFYKSFSAYQNIINSLPKDMNPTITEALFNIKNNCTSIIDSNMLNTPVYNANTLLNSIENFSDYIQENASELSNDELIDISENLPNDLTDDNSKSSSSDLINNSQNTSDATRQIDWKFLITLILSILSLSLTILGHVENANSSRATSKFEANVITLMEQMNESSKHQVNINIKGNK